MKTANGTSGARRLAIVSSVYVEGLYGLFASADLQNIDVGIFPSAYASGEEKRLPEYTLLELAPRLLCAGAISEAEVRRLAGNARAYTERTDTLVILPPMIQVWGNKPG